MYRTALFLGVWVLSFIGVNAQGFGPGFDKEEYTALMKVSARFGDSAYSAAIPLPAGYRFLYRSPVVGLDNRWDLWQTNNGIPVISIRGTTQKEISWMENFYAAMVPAKGVLQLSKGESFAYKLAENDRAAVHIGWLLGTAFLAKDMLPKIDSCYKTGQRDFYIIGHSQGGAIAYLLTAMLHHLQKQGALPAALRFKTYCSAAPKPGNLYFAYEYEALTQGGWAYNVVNAADWVPQTPFSVQTVDDFTAINPFVNAKAIIKKNSWPKRWLLNYAYGRLTRPSNKARKNYRKYLGDYVAKTVKKALPGYAPPKYANTSDYVRTGNIITLLPSADYYEKFPQQQDKVFGNHLHPAYLYLVNQLHMPEASANSAALGGAWELTSIMGENTSLLYPDKKPQLRFDLSAKRVNGNTGCNNFNGPLQAAGTQISFAEPMATTRMACPGSGEQVFLQALKKANRFWVSNGRLTFFAGEQALMEFQQKQSE